MLRLRPVLSPRAPRVLPLRVPDDGDPPSRPAGSFLSPVAGGPGRFRVALHVLLAALPLLAISAHVFGLVPMQLSAALLVIPLATTLAVLTAFDPHPGDRVIVHGLAWGVLACATYDVFRLDTVYMLGLWGDFIPTMGTWIIGRPDDLAGGAVVGYLWRYIGDGGGIGLTFFVVASVFGLQRLSRAQVVLAAVGFAVAPVWAGLIGTVALAPRGEELMFPLTPITVTLSLVGHLIFGLVLGLGFWHSRGAQAHWPWAPLDLPARMRPATAPPDAAPVGPVPRPSGPPASVSLAPMSSTPGPPAPNAPVPASPAAGPPTPNAPAPAWPAAGPPAPGSPPPVSPAPGSPAAGSPTPGRAAPVSPATALPGRVLPDSERSGADRAEWAPARPAWARPETSGSEPPAPARAFVPRQRTSSTPPAAQTLDPDTWEQWRHRLETTQPGRRAHGGRPAADPAPHGPA